MLAISALSSWGLAWGQPRSRVAIVAPPLSVTDQDELRTRLRAELLANGFEVVDATEARDGGVVDPRASVEAAITECDAVAAFALVAVKDGAVVDVWLSDAVTNKTLVRRLSVGEQHTGQLDASLLAVQAVELLRASLTELDPLKRVLPGSAQDEEPDAQPACHNEEAICPSASPKPERDVASSRSPAPVQEPAAATRGARTREPRPNAPPTAPEDRAEAGHSMVVAGALAIGWVRGVGAQAGTDLGLGYVSPFGLGARLALVGPMLGEDIQGTNGSAVVRETKILAAATYRFWAAPDIFSIEPALAGGAHRVHVEGHARAPFQPLLGNMWTFVLDVGAAGALWVDPRLAIELGAHAAVSLPPIELRIAGEAVATVDLPILYATAGLLVAP